MQLFVLLEANDPLAVSSWQTHVVREDNSQKVDHRDGRKEAVEGFLEVP